MKKYVDRYEKVSQVIWWMQSLELRLLHEPDWMKSFKDLKAFQDEILEKLIETMSDVATNIMLVDLSREEKIEILNYAGKESNNYELIKSFLEETQDFSFKEQELVLENFTLLRIDKSLQDVKQCYMEELDSKKYFIAYLSKTITLLDDIIKEHQSWLDEMEKDHDEDDYKKNDFIAVISSCEFSEQYLRVLFDEFYNEDEIKEFIN